MNESNKRTMIFLIVIGITTLLVAVIGATFAYFTANIRYVDGPSEVVTKSEVLEIIFKRKNDIFYENIFPGRPGYESQAINELKNSLRFSVESNSAMSSRTPYNVYFTITENTFPTSKNDTTYSNVVYILNGTPGISPIEKTDENGNPINLNSTLINTCIPESGIQTVTCGRGQYFDAFNSVLHTFEGDTLPTKLGRIEAGFTGKVKIGTAILGSYGAKDEWEFELWVNETGAPQNEDQGRIIRGYIEIDTEDNSFYTNEPSQVTTP